MYRLGHTGIALLVLAPLTYVLVEAHRPLLALVTVLGVVGVEPLPDSDFALPFLQHRGVSHSLLAAVSVGGILGLCGWVVAGPVSTALPPVFTAVSEAATTGATTLQSLTLSGTTGRIAGLLRSLADSLGWTGSQLQGLDRQTVAGFGFAIGAGGILVHLLGDVITVSGIRPLLPVSSRQISLSSLRANSTLANTGLFAVGALALVVVLVTTVAGTGVVAVPADLSPVDVAAGQSTTQTTTQTQNASSPNATVTVANQTTNGSTVRVQSATLPDGGFVVLTNDPYGEIGLLEESIIAVSKPLSPGTHRNITLRVRRSPPGGYLNRTTLDTTSDYAVGLHRDTNNNSRFEYITSAGNTDGAYFTGSGTDRRYASDAATITIPGSNTPTPTASIRFPNQSTNGSTVTVRSVTLPSGGFVVVHNESYLRGGDPTQTAIGLSGYLSAGTHRNVSVTLVNGSLQQSQTLVAVPSRDTNGNQTYDYVRSEGFQDPAYTGNGEIITDPASVTVAGSTSPASESSSARPSTPARSDTSQPATDTATGAEGGSGAWVSAMPLVVGGGIVVVVVVGVSYLIRRS
jgi:membrane-bound metal-dependent hydrolase YbcI (DUF457 family)